MGRSDRIRRDGDRRRRRQGAELFLPDLPNLEFWNDPSTLTSGLIASYPDYTGNYTAVAAGADRPTALVEAGQTVVDFVVAPQYLDMGATLQTFYRGSFTVGVIIKPDDGQSPSQPMVWGLNNGTNNNRVYCRISAGGGVTFFYGANSQTAQATTNAAVFNNGPVLNYKLIIFTMDATIQGVGGMKIYDGDTSLALAGGAPGDTTGVVNANYSLAINTYFGAENGNGTDGSHYVGLMGDYFGYSRVLSSGEITRIANAFGL